MFQLRSHRITAWAALCGCLGGIAATGWNAKPVERPGILLLAHGGQLQWNEEVHHVADKADLAVPTEIAFGMANPRSIQDGINRLTARGVTRIIAVPLFISSYSSVITSTEYLLGLRPDAPQDLAMFASMDHSSMNHASPNQGSPENGVGDRASMDQKPSNPVVIKPVTSKAPISMTPALNHHEIVASILLDRAASVSDNPSNEVVLLVAHGPVPDDDNKKWLGDMAALADEMQKSSHYAAIEYLTLRDDADDPVRKQASEELRQRVEGCQQKGQTVLVVPVLLSYGGIEGGIRKRLAGLNYRMPSQGLLPDERIVQWVLDVAHASAAQGN